MEQIEKSKAWLKPKLTWLRESWEEVRHRVTWPSKEEVIGTCRIVIVAIIVFAIIVGIMDTAMLQGMRIVFGMSA